MGGMKCLERVYEIYLHMTMLQTLYDMNVFALLLQASTFLFSHITSRLRYLPQNNIDTDNCDDDCAC